MVFIAESEESKQIRGKILADITDIEMELTEFLADYFGNTKKKKEELFNFIFNTELFNFNKKIIVFRKVMNKRFWFKYEKLIKSLDWLKENRNKMAHWQWSPKDSQNKTSVLKDPRSKKTIKVDNKLLEEHKKHWNIIMEFFEAYFVFTNETL